MLGTCEAVGDAVTDDWSPTMCDSGENDGLALLTATNNNSTDPAIPFIEFGEAVDAMA